MHANVIIQFNMVVNTCYCCSCRENVNCKNKSLASRVTSFLFNSINIFRVPDWHLLLHIVCQVLVLFLPCHMCDPWHFHTLLKFQSPSCHLIQFHTFKMIHVLFIPFLWVMCRFFGMNLEMMHVLWHQDMMSWSGNVSMGEEVENALCDI